MQHDTTDLSPRRRRIERRPYSACDGLGEFLARELEATEFRFAWVTFPVLQTAEDLAVDGVVPEWYDDAIVHDYYSGFLITHPQLGAILLDEPWVLQDDDELTPAEQLHEHYDRVRRLAAEMLDHLHSDDPLWCEHQPAWSFALVFEDPQLAATAISGGVPERAVLLLDDDAVLPDALRALATTHEPDADGRPDDFPCAEQLLAPLAELLGPCFVGSESYVADCQIEALQEANQLENARRAAEKRGVIECVAIRLDDDAER